MDWVVFMRTFGCVLIVLYLIFGIDDIIWILSSLVSRLIHHRKSGDEHLSFEIMRRTPPKMLAVTIAAWHEANVIGDVIMNFLNTADYPKSMVHLFVGVYPNDPDTIAAVTEVSKIFPNVHPVINCQEGPTTKAQNINHVIRQIRRFEEEHGIRFASLTVHDSEDVIHSYELLATNYLIDAHDAIQFPVFPILEMPRFSNFFRQMTTATYADEFAENHYITLIQRRDLKAFVPCAGTGFALSRKCLDLFGDEDVLPSGSLTEDYLLSLILYKKGIPLHYVLDRLPRVTENGKIRMDYITTRSLFPATFRAAVRQKTRWTYGITMQSVHLSDVFKSRGIPLAGRYTFYKDLRGKLVNLLPLIGYIASVYGMLAILFHWGPFYEQGSPVAYMALAVLLITIVRQTFRAYALYHVYGFRSVFFGCLLPPLFPLRLIYGNIINFVATWRAIKMRITGGRMAPGKQGRSRKQAPRKGVKWAKTDHTFLSRDQLRRYRRMLGDSLIMQGYLTPEQFREALDHVDRAHGQQIGAYLIRQGLITEEQMTRALGHVKHIQFIPDDVAERLDYPEALKSFDPAWLLKLQILPLTFKDDTWIIGITSETSDQAQQIFREKTGSKVDCMYLTPLFLKKALSRAAKAARNQSKSRASNKTTGNQSKSRSAMKTSRNHPSARRSAGSLSSLRDYSSSPLSSLRDYHAGLITYEQLILIGIYSSLLARPESEIRRYMGL